MAVHREAIRARWDGAMAKTRERSVVISATSSSLRSSSLRSSSSLEAAGAARLVQGLQPARGHDRDGRLVNRELVLIGSAVEARRQAWPVEEGSRGSRAVAVRHSGTTVSASTRQASAAPVACSEAAHPCRMTPPHPRSHDPGRVAQSSADHCAPLPRANSLHPAPGLRRPCATRPHPRAVGA